jgi:hypothetical protein
MWIVDVGAAVAAGVGSAVGDAVGRRVGEAATGEGVEVAPWTDSDAPPRKPDAKRTTTRARPRSAATATGAGSDSLWGSLYSRIGR